MPIPSDTFLNSDTVIATRTVIEIKPTGAATSTVFSVEELNEDNSYEFTTIERVQSDGLIRAVRKVPQKQKESFKPVIFNVKKLMALFGGNHPAGYTLEADVEIWIKDPGDAAGKCSFHIVKHKAALSVEGGLGFKATEATKATLMIEPLEKTVWEADYTIPA